MRMVGQAAALLDYGFALPATTPVGTLVDARPAPPTPPAPAAAAPEQPTPGRTDFPIWLATAAAVLALGVAATAVLRRRR
ncbi:D-alanyl-D-alanine carboxypeptidase (penicillin-binding protein 5/6) [Pseudonocardia oroxyli]|uniref:D-alanyl-D-alanine carboxypeptidase (Penicillin-binding protein 5/6) n=1 Tax=Pseudonocardia oroxyli TaxID=366584 RepID=A0A1G7GVD6_PSEOR|nr:D-alanyl-D-alanine carboxypeptidase (penicillin-binding protein 5/6) [Pseudonocardia oroxyli]